MALLFFFFSVHGKSEFQLPPNLGTALEDGHFDHLEDCMFREHYRQRLHMLLHIEEFERRRQMTRFYNHFKATSSHFHVVPVKTKISIFWIYTAAGKPH